MMTSKEIEALCHTEEPVENSSGQLEDWTWSLKECVYALQKGVLGVARQSWPWKLNQWKQISLELRQLARRNGAYALPGGFRSQVAVIDHCARMRKTLESGKVCCSKTELQAIELFKNENIAFYRIFDSVRDDVLYGKFMIENDFIAFFESEGQDRKTLFFRWATLIWHENTHGWPERGMCLFDITDPDDLEVAAEEYLRVLKSPLREMADKNMYFCGAKIAVGMLLRFVRDEFPKIAQRRYAWLRRGLWKNRLLTEYLRQKMDVSPVDMRAFVTSADMEIELEDIK